MSMWFFLDYRAIIHSLETVCAMLQLDNFTCEPRRFEKNTAALLVKLSRGTRFDKNVVTHTLLL